ncbi:MAG: NifU N-terminal domain-containing protein [Candidatus Berkelbacteria bacterium]|nr:NifU N-terminal domain-containing protein [Candidatus Berkelbacteria bacterium]
MFVERGVAKMMSSQPAMLEMGRTDEDVTAVSYVKVGERYGNPDMLALHTRAEICRSVIEHFMRPLRPKSEEYLAHAGPLGSQIVRGLMAIKGVKEVFICPYEISICKAGAYTWNEICPQAVKVIKRAIVMHPLEQIYGSPWRYKVACFKASAAGWIDKMLARERDHDLKNIGLGVIVLGFLLFDLQWVGEYLMWATVAAGVAVAAIGPIIRKVRDCFKKKEDYTADEDSS